MKAAQINQQNPDQLFYNVSHLKQGVKLWISILFGVTSFVLSPFGYSATMGEIVINIPWTIVFPILASMAFGWRYGIIASLAGGAYFPFLLWPNNGWANVLTTVLFSIFFTSIGLINGKSIKIGKPVLFYRIFLILFLVICALGIGYLVMFNHMLSMNPPFWQVNSIHHLDKSTLLAFLTKDSINIVFLTIVCESLLCLRFIRRFFGLEVRSFMRVNTTILFSVILASFFLWWIYYLLDFALFQSHLGMHDGHIPLVLFVIIVGGFVAARFIIHYTEKQLLTKDMLRESEEKYRLSFLTSPDSVNINKMDGTYVEVNESFSKITGYTKEEVIGKLSSELELWAIPEDRAKLVKGLKEKGTVENMESVFRCKDGSLKTALMSARIIKLNNAPHILSITRDITERVQMELALKESEKQFRLLFERSNDAIFLINKRNGRYLDANKAAENLTGYSVSEIKKMKTSDITPIDTKARLSKVANINETIEMGEIEYVRSDKSIRVATASVIPLNDETIFGISHDITERKHFESKLRIFSRAIDQSPVLVLITNNIGEIEYVNQKFTQVTQYSFDEAIGRNPRFLKSGNTSAKEYKTMWKTIKAGKEWNGEFSNVKKDGEQFWESAVISPIFNEKSEITHFVALKEDITERKETERRILSTIIETEERERNRLSCDLHDGLGPLLSTIKLYFQWLSETDEPEKKKLITEKGGKNLNEAIESIREISNNLSPRTLNTFGIEAAIKNFMENLNQTQKLTVTFQSNIENRLDKNIEITLYRIVTELLNNTIKYAKASKSEIRLNVDEEKQWITLTYTDNGIGFDMKKVKGNTKGFGLVNITQRINTFNGKMNLVSSIGKGIQATIALPLNKN